MVAVTAMAMAMAMVTTMIQSACLANSLVLTRSAIGFQADRLHVLISSALS
jgi:hypothetical protein